jgi:hypothetical protein
VRVAAQGALRACIAAGGAVQAVRRAW